MSATMPHSRSRAPDRMLGSGLQRYKCGESTVPGIAAVHALRVAGTNVMVELFSSFAIASAPRDNLTALSCR
jgi:hypothetical protein